MASHNWLAIRSFILGTALAVCPWAQPQAPVSAEQGMASWYGDAFQGQRSASGEIYDQQQLTAAHRTLPFGTKVRVRRLDSEASIVVRINDRGPFVGSRIIDVSSAAARLLGMMDFGTVPVSVEVVEAPAAAPAPTPVWFAVQTGSFRNADNARRMRDSLAGKYGEASIVAMHDYWRVLVGRAATQSEAESLAKEVRQSGKLFESALVVRM